MLIFLYARFSIQKWLKDYFKMFSIDFLLGLGYMSLFTVSWLRKYSLYLVVPMSNEIFFCTLNYNVAKSRFKVIQQIILHEISLSLRCGIARSKQKMGGMTSVFPVLLVSFCN